MSRYRIILGDASLPLSRLLDVHVVDVADMTARRGYGALLGSLHDPPTRIWSRSDKQGVLYSVPLAHSFQYFNP